ncbi:MAG: LLM class flavin-dependent oxidoreductase [Chitinophagales bacterium]
MMEIGLSTFGDMLPEPLTGGAVRSAKRVQQLLEEIQLADAVQLDVFALGEHHRPDFVISAPEVLLAAAAATTKNIRLSSAVTVLSSADPVRTYQNFATVDLISKGRTEIMAGRGSFIESFPLFGYDLRDYDSLFEEKLDLLLKINASEKVKWKGRHRPEIDQLGVYPRPFQAQLPIWIGVGGTPESAIRAGELGLPMMIAILGGPPERFSAFSNWYREAATTAGHQLSELQLGINTHYYAADTDEQAIEEFYPAYAQLMNRVGQERGWAPLNREQFEYNRLYGPLMVGSPDFIVEKLLRLHRIFGQTRYMAQLVGGAGLNHRQTLHAIQLLGEKIAPAVRQSLKAV